MAELPEGDIKQFTKDEQLGVLSHYLLGARERNDSLLVRFYGSLMEPLFGPTIRDR